MANRIITDEMVETLAKWASPDAFVFGQEALSKQPAALARSREILKKLAPMILEEAAKVADAAMQAYEKTIDRSIMAATIRQANIRSTVAEKIAADIRALKGGGG